jgi:hypothetical protein
LNFEKLRFAGEILMKTLAKARVFLYLWLFLALPDTLKRYQDGRFAGLRL